MLEKVSKDKNPSLLHIFVKYERKMFAILALGPYTDLHSSVLVFLSQILDLALKWITMTICQLHSTAGSQKLIQGWSDKHTSLVAAQKSFEIQAPGPVLY